MLLKRQAEPYPSYGEAELLKRLATNPSWALREYHQKTRLAVDEEEMLRLVRKQALVVQFHVAPG